MNKREVRLVRYMRGKAVNSQRAAAIESSLAIRTLMRLNEFRLAWPDSRSHNSVIIRDLEAQAIRHQHSAEWYARLARGYMLAAGALKTEFESENDNAQ